MHAVLAQLGVSLADAQTAPDRFIASPLPRLPASWDAMSHLPVRHRLAPAALRRFNQLYACACHEQIAFLEVTGTEHLIKPLMTHPDWQRERSSLTAFYEQEVRHYQAFRAWNQAYEPRLYADDGLAPRFVCPTVLQSRCLAAMGRSVHRWPWLLWFILMQEERGVHLALDLEATPAHIAPEMLVIHRWHLRDEAQHLDLVKTLIERLWPATPAWLRRVNAAVLLRLLREYFTAPKRAGSRVVQAWLGEFPEYQNLRQDLLAQLQALAKLPDFLDQQYGPRRIGRTLDLMARWPEFDAFRRWVADNHREANP